MKWLSSPVWAFLFLLTALTLFWVLVFKDVDTRELRKELKQVKTERDSFEIVGLQEHDTAIFYKEVALGHERVEDSLKSRKNEVKKEFIVIKEKVENLPVDDAIRYADSTWLK